MSNHVKLVSASLLSSYHDDIVEIRRDHNYYAARTMMRFTLSLILGSIALGYWVLSR